MTKKLLLVILFLGLCNSAYAAELLVRASPHWMDSLTQAEVDKMTPEQKQSYEARGQIGDIVSVAPDGWKWGKEECLPIFIVVKVPGMTEAEAKKYEEPLTEAVIEKMPDGKDMPIQKMIRFRKHTLPKSDVISATTGTVSLTKASLDSKIRIKTGAATEIVSPAKEDLAFYGRKLRTYVSHWLVRPVYAGEFLHKHVMPAGGDYTKLEDCMHANEQNLTGDGWFTVEIGGDWSGGADTTAVTIHNYTTTASDYINIYTTSAARHDGVWSASKYILQKSGGAAGTMALSNSAKYIRIVGLQVNLDSGNANSLGCIFTVDALGSQTCDIQINNNIIKETNAISGQQHIGIYIAGGNTVKMWNNIVYDFSGTACWAYAIYPTGETCYFYNNTARGSTVGFNIVGGGTAPTAVMVNNLIDSCTTAAVGTYVAPTDYNATNLATMNYTVLGGGNIHDHVSHTFTFVGAADFHLASTDVGAIDLGTADPGSGLFSDDIDGVARGATWDIGADEYVAAATGFGQVI